MPSVQILREESESEPAAADLPIAIREDIKIPESLSTSSPTISSERKTSTSPLPNHFSKNAPLLESEVASLTQAILSVSHRSARTAVRQNWRKCVIGSKEETPEESKSDESFLVRAILKHGNSYVLKRVVEEYGDQLLAQAPEETLQKLMKSHGEHLLSIATEETLQKLMQSHGEHLLSIAPKEILQNLMNSHGEQLLSVAPEEVLDRVLEMRLRNIDAKVLVKMLAKADRLGYSETDLVDEKDERVGVMPNGRQQVYESDDTDVMEIDPPSPKVLARDDSTGPRSDPPKLYFAPPLPEQAYGPINLPPPPGQSVSALPQMTLASRGKAPNHVPGSKHICPDCGGSFTQSAGLRYHTANQVCTKNKAATADDQFSCEKCHKGFTNRKGYIYHRDHNVCQSHEMAQATPQGQATYAAPPPQGPPQSQNPSYYASGVSNGTPPGYSPHSGPQQSQHAPPPPVYLPPPNPSHARQYQSAYGKPQPYPQHVPLHVQQSQYNPHLHSHPHQGPPQNYPDFRITTGNPTVPSNQTPVRPISTPVPSPMSGPQLAPEKLQEMNRKLTKEMERFERVMKEIPENLTAVDRDEEIQKIKRGHATRKSMIRKAYGIQVRKSKLRPANAITTPQGELDMSAISSRSVTPSSGSAPSFAPINRLEAFRAAAPSPLANQVLPALQGRPGSILESNDPKRRRYDEQADVPALRIVDYVPKPFKSLGSAPEKERTPLPTQIDVEPTVAVRVQDIIDRNTLKESPAQESRPTSASSNSAASATTSDAQPPKRVPIGEAQKHWETMNAVKPSPVETPPLNTPTSPVSSASTKSTDLQATKASLPIEPISIPSDADSQSDDEDIPARKPTPTRTTSRSASKASALATKVTRSETPGRERRASMRNARAAPVKTTRATAKV